MKLDTFIKRPIFSAVISVLIVLVGVLSAMTLPIEKYPDIAPPTVQVKTAFFGANCETLMNSVVSPLEQSINGVENMLYMNGTAANNGSVNIDVVFKQGTNPDIAAVNVQNRIQKVMGQLPAEVKQFGVTTVKKQNSMLQIFSVYSPDDTYDEAFIANYSSINIEPKMLLINGIGQFQALGSDYSVRVWLDPGAMAQHKLDPVEVGNMLSAQNIEAAAGSIGENSNETYQYAMRYTGRLKSISQFENIVLRSEADGTVLRLKDVAKIELGLESYSFSGQTDGHPSVMCICYQAAGSNATEVNNNITKSLDEIRADAPSGVDIVSVMNSNDFLYSAVEQVLETLRDAIILVILVVLIFLKDFKSTIIPFLSIMVSLIGTFAFLTVAGFSINLLTLFALVLVIGTVVDDSIVVVEAVHAQFESGVESGMKATVNAIKAVAKPVLTSSLVFMAVFIPVSFLPGTSGVFYRQFGLTMAVAVGISAINALSLVPAMSALMLKHIKKIEPGEKGTFKQRYAQKFDGFFEKFVEKYKSALEKAMNFKAVFWIICLGCLAGLVVLMKIMPSGLVPEEDQGSIIVEINLPPGSSLYASKQISDRFSAEAGHIDGVENVCTTAGYGFIAGESSSSAVCIVKLADWSERKSKEKSLAGITAKLQEIGTHYPEANFIVFTLPMIPGYGNNSGITMYVQNRRGASTQELYDVTKKFISDLGQYGIGGFMAFNLDFPQWEISVDVEKSLRAGLSPRDVMNAIGAYYGGSYVSDVNLYSKVYKVMLMGDPNTRRDEFSLHQTSIKTASGEMSPLSNFVHVKRVYGPETLATFNKFPSINVSVMTALSTGDALNAINEAARKYLPEGYTIEYSGMAREQDSQGGLGLVLILCSFIIYLILAALYESLTIPFAVLLAVPAGLFASYLSSKLVGLDNNIYLQTGVIMLIGLLAKTAILITEYAVERHEAGMDSKESAIAAAGDRLRPIIMTAGVMIIGMLPLALSKGGVGGNGNFSLGLGTIVGVFVGTIGLLFITPSLYITMQNLQDKMKKKEEPLDEIE